MLSDLLVGFYLFVHGRLHLPGAGWLLRRVAPMLPRLQAYPFPVPEVGVALLDFRDAAACSMMNFFSLGELGLNDNLILWLEKALQPGDVLWDVGANVGMVSGHFAHPRFQLSSLHAFEPNPAPFKTLRSLLSNNTRCVVHPFGMGDQDQTITMSLSRGGSVIGSVVHDFHEGKQIQVQVHRGDTALRELRLPVPHVIKIDVEGFEPNVFAGLTETIAQHHPVLAFEHTHLTDQQIQGLIPRGYQLYFIQTDGTLKADISARHNGYDAIVVPAEKAGRFKLEPCPA
jgi:FkbM family methyltransferase